MTAVNFNPKAVENKFLMLEELKGRLNGRTAAPEASVPSTVVNSLGVVAAGRAALESAMGSVKETRLDAARVSAPPVQDHGTGASERTALIQKTDEEQETLSCCQRMMQIFCCCFPCGQK